MLRCIQLLVCVVIVGVALLAYVERQNELTKMRMQVPLLTKKLQAIVEENTRLQFEIEKFENPINLMELARQPQFGHLKHPLVTDIIHIVSTDVVTANAGLDTALADAKNSPAVANQQLVADVQSPKRSTQQEPHVLYPGKR